MKPLSLSTVSKSCCIFLSRGKHKLVGERNKAESLHLTIQKRLGSPYYFHWNCITVICRLLYIFTLSSIDSPTAVLSYNRTTSIPGTQPLHLIFNDGAPGPAITCSASGYPPPVVEWIRDNGRGLPSGILQQVAPSSNGEKAIQLRWQREMEFTDSGSYVCRAFNNNGTDSATLELLVQSKYTMSCSSCSIMNQKHLLIFFPHSSTDYQQYFSF